MRSSVIARGIRLGTATRLAGAIVIGGGVLSGCSSDNPTSTLVSAYSGDQQIVTVASAVPQPLVVYVNDGNAHGISGVQVSFTASGGATLSAATATTDANGLASITVTAGTKSGTDTVTATAASATPLQFSVIANPGAPSAIVATTGNNQTDPDGSTVTLATVVTDSYGNPIPNETIDWTTTAGQISAPTASSDSTGMAQDVIQLPATPATVVTVTATVDGTPLKATFTDTTM